MSENIWIHLWRLCYGYIYKSGLLIGSIIFGSNKKIGKDSVLLDEILSGGPQSFAVKPTAIKLGRALFVPIILISHIYDLKDRAKK